MTAQPAPVPAEVHNALLRVRYAVTKEDRHKCGLEYIANRLDDARASAEAAAERILPAVADMKLNPAPSLASLCATPPGWTPALNLSELGELIFAQLQKEVALKPDVELLYHGNKRLETFASDWFVFLFGWRNDGGCLAFMRKKIVLARALGEHKAADKLDEAFRQLMPTFPLKDCGDEDIKRFAAAITPDGFHKATRTALELDAEATDEINSARQTTSTGPIGHGLNPERIKKDALAFMTRLVCYVWCMIPAHGSKQRAMDYVFRDAKDGDRLFSDCLRARNLLALYRYNPSTVQLEAAKEHSKLTSWHKKTGLEWPDNWRDMVKKSKETEIKQRRSAKRKRKP